MVSLVSAVDYSNPQSLGSRLRRRRIGTITQMIEAVAAQKGSVDILDVGGRRVYWDLFSPEFLHRNKVSVTLLNMEDKEAWAADDSEGFRNVTGDACDLSQYRDRQFDIVHSNSTIEHVGNWTKMAAFAKETARVGRRYYVQTPYYWFPIEPHFLMPMFHWLPDGLRAKMLVTIGAPAQGRSPDIAHAMHRLDDARLLDRTQMSALFPDAHLQFEWLGPLPKSIIATRGA
jgi:hypothetical protein